MRKRGRTKLLFQHPIAGDDGFGPNPSAGGWSEGIAIGVNLIPANGSERERNGAVVSEQVYRVEVRSLYFSNPDTAINATWRVVDELGKRVFNIIGIAQKDNDLRWTNVVIALGQPN